MIVYISNTNNKKIGLIWFIRGSQRKINIKIIFDIKIDQKKPCKL